METEIVSQEYATVSQDFWGLTALEVNTQTLSCVERQYMLGGCYPSRDCDLFYLCLSPPASSVYSGMACDARFTSQTNPCLDLEVTFNI